MLNYVWLTQPQLNPRFTSQASLGKSLLNLCISGTAVNMLILSRVSRTWPSEDHETISHLGDRLSRFNWET